MLKTKKDFSADKMFHATKSTTAPFFDTDALVGVAKADDVKAQKKDDKVKNVGQKEQVFSYRRLLAQLGLLLSIMFFLLSLLGFYQKNQDRRAAVEELRQFHLKKEELTLYTSMLSELSPTGIDRAQAAFAADYAYVPRAGDALFELRMPQLSFPNAALKTKTSLANKGNSTENLSLPSSSSTAFNRDDKDGGVGLTLKSLLSNALFLLFGTLVFFLLAYFLSKRFSQKNAQGV